MNIRQLLGRPFNPMHRPEDGKLVRLLKKQRFGALRMRRIPSSCMTVTKVCEPDERFGFLHEAAIIAHHGVLYASWYHNESKELQGDTPICGKRSRDGGKTWSPLEILMEDPTGTVMYCPPVYGVCDDRLYMLVNQMVGGKPDHIHSLDLYMLDEESGAFRLRWSRPIPFKLNTNVVSLPDGRLLLPGRIAEPDGFPNTPAVMISDSGKIDAPWRVVHVSPNGTLPDGTALVHPETTVMEHRGRLYMFNRNDKRQVPLAYVSGNMGETWSAPIAHDLPIIASKMYGGTLSDGRHYLVANTKGNKRDQLTLYLTEKHSMIFCEALTLFDKSSAEMPGVTACHYPAAVEYNGQLLIIATCNYDWSRRGAVLFTVQLNKI